ncbi:hypothetical protein [Pseudomonas sp. RW10S2]|uniref:hypothetical protein n=1 Tax=Pseudomonas TaxID=286 RepID=UPI0016460C82|nr:hypothetical protein [Pseudomonas sp. RW10S2]MBC3468494.1 hypothetical protein [Pseudomonas sp. RW10S2]QXI42505.1 hypothetical protein HU734_019965 [Pseudomonas wayambapalatensis]
MNLTKYLLLAILAVGSTSVFAEGGAERSQRFVDTFLKEQQRLFGDRQEVLVKRERQAQETAREVAKE